MMPDNSAYNLGTSLGQLVMGNPQRRQDAFLQGQQAGALVNDRMASARKSRADAMLGEDRLTARQGITPEIIAQAGYSPDQATLIGSILRANDSVKLGDIGPLAIPQAGAAFQRAADAANLGDMTTANRQLAIAGGKPMETTKIADGTAFNAFDDPSQTMHTTALGDATIGARKAQAAASYGQANAANAHARLFDKQTSVGGFNPRAGGMFGNNDNSFTPEAQEMLATAAEQGFNLPIPSVGMGGAARVQYVNGLAKSLKDKNIPIDLAIEQMRYGLTADPGIKQSQKLYSATKTLEAGADALAQQALELSGTVGRGQIPVFNEWINAGRRATSDPNIARFDRAINAFTNDYAKVVSGALGSSAGTDSSIAEAKRQLRASNSPEEFAANVDQMQKEMHVRTDGMLESIRGQVTNLANRGRSPGSTPAANTQLGSQVTAPSPASRPTTQAQFNALPSGAMYVDPDDGKTYRKP